MGRLLFITGLAVVLTGCASISEDQCLAGNWEALGFKDGSNGYAASRISDYADVCSKYDVSVDTKLYLTSHEQGVQRYCTPQRGYDAGENGSSFNQVCSSFAGYEDGYSEGYIVYEIEQGHQALHSDYDAALADYEDVEFRLQDEALSADEHKRLKKKLKRLKRELNDLERELADYESSHDLTCNY